MKKIKDIHGGSIEKIAGALNLRQTSAEIKYDFSVNINPLDYPDSLEKLLFNPDRYISSYPPIEPDEAEKFIAEKIKIPSSHIVLANGATEIFNLILQSLKPSLAAWPLPSYSGYAELCVKNSIAYKNILQDIAGLKFSTDFKKLAALKSELIFICNPNNPTGQFTEANTIRDFALAHPDIHIVLDESFMDFSDKISKFSLLGKDMPDNLIIVKSLTKTFAAAGLRIGYAVASPKIISGIKALRLPWTVNGLAQESLRYLMNDDKYIERSIKAVSSQRALLYEVLTSVKGIETYPSETDFILCRLSKNSGCDADSLLKNLLKYGILLRSCSRMDGLDKMHFRLAVRHETEIYALSDALVEILGCRRKLKKPKQPCPALMIVGTASNSGKSLITAAFCRYYSNKGIDVAPFKAQNMALNSFVSKDGGEMGRAQVVQAQAARIEPETLMNPVLLKPLGDSSSQIIINGKAVSKMKAAEYYKNKDSISKKAFEAYDKLAAKHELIVLEGAGSPAEINLFDKDFVNMRMAEYAKAKVILVADIDRGGVFASIFGTVKLIPRKWRCLIKGIIINKFRGDKALLGNGLEEIEKLTGIPVLGVMPYIPGLQIEDEDSLGLEERKKVIPEENSVKIAVIRLPRISNYTDFMPFEHIKGVSLVYAETPAALKDANMIIIPGTKNTIEDMKFLLENGFEHCILKAAGKDIPIIGICGGFQMLGEEICDPYGVEGTTKNIRGLGLLPVRTVLGKEKELAQVKGTALPSLPFIKKQTEFSGYEIHAGRTEFSKGQNLQSPLLIKERNGKAVKENAGVLKGSIFGTYIHGFFNAPGVKLGLINELFDKKGMLFEVNKPQTQLDSIREASFEKLSVELITNIDMTFADSLLK